MSWRARPARGVPVPRPWPACGVPRGAVRRRVCNTRRGANENVRQRCRRARCRHDICCPPTNYRGPLICTTVCNVCATDELRARLHKRSVLSVACARRRQYCTAADCIPELASRRLEAHSATRARAHVPYAGAARGAVARCRAARSSTCFSASCRPPAPAQHLLDSAFQCVRLRCHLLQTAMAARAPDCL